VVKVLGKWAGLTPSRKRWPSIQICLSATFLINQGVVMPVIEEFFLGGPVEGRDVGVDAVGVRCEAATRVEIDDAIVVRDVRLGGAIHALGDHPEGGADIERAGALHPKANGKSVHGAGDVEELAIVHSNHGVFVVRAEVQPVRLWSLKRASPAMTAANPLTISTVWAGSLVSLKSQCARRMGGVLG
jgi:hypothetical protein